MHKIVPWFDLTWEETQKRGLVQKVADHISDMEPEQLREYGLYLTDCCKWPKGILKELSKYSL
jgi:hypothetical protein